MFLNCSMAPTVYDQIEIFKYFPKELFMMNLTPNYLNVLILCSKIIPWEGGIGVNSYIKKLSKLSNKGWISHLVVL